VRQDDDRFRIRALLLGQLAVLAAGALLSSGVHHEDSLAHFLIARGAWASPANLLDAWGRPGCTAPLALVASIGSPETGLVLARLLNALMAVATTWLTFLAARELGLAWPLLAAALVATQPLFFVLGYSTLTEMPCAFYLAAALVAGLRGRHVQSAAWLSLTLVTRHECVVFAAVWLFWWLAERRRGRLTAGRFLAAVLAVTWAPILVNVAAWMLLGKIPWAVLFEAKPAGGGFYGHGLVTTMATYWMVAAGPLLTVLVPFGLTALRRSRGFGLVAGSFLIYLGVHSLLHTLNLFASGGYPRFLVTVAAPVALLGAAGWGRLVDHARTDRGRVAWLVLALWAAMAVAADVEVGRFVRLRPETSRWWPEASRWWPVGQWIARGALAATLATFLGRRLRRRKEWARFTIRGVIGIAVALHVVNFAVFVRLPLRRTDEQRRMVAAARWTAGRFPDRVVLAWNEWFLFGLDRGRRVDVDFAWNRIEAARAGTLYLCDVAERDYRVDLGARPVDYYRSSPRFREIPLPGAEDGRLGLFEKRAARREER
jgi:hypothetical protein